MKLQVFNIQNRFNPKHVITNPEIVGKDNEFLPDGLYSELIFGANNSNFEHLYSCNCGNLYGKFYEGLTCPDCNSEVIEFDSLINRLGWIDIAPHRIFTPYFWILVQKVIGETALNKIVSVQPKVDINGNEIIEQNDKFIGYGFQYLVNNIEEVLKVYTKADKQSYTDFILDNLDKCFLDKLPVISTKLRPARLNGEELQYDKINNFYRRIMISNETLRSLEQNECTDGTVNPLLHTVQTMMNEIGKSLFSALSGKGGWFRNNFLANRLCFSSRSVITPFDSSFSLDEIHLPYYSCLELFKLHIVNILVKKNRCTYTKALNKWHRALTVYDHSIVNIVQEEIIDKSYFTTSEGKKRRGYHMLINRNPTINKGSILMVRVTKIKTDMSDLTMSMHNLLLPMLAGD